MTTSSSMSVKARRDEGATRIVTAPQWLESYIVASVAWVAWGRCAAGLRDHV